jgi:hypothetical protein
MYERRRAVVRLGGLNDVLKQTQIPRFTINAHFGAPRSRRHIPNDSAKHGHARLTLPARGHDVRSRNDVGIL